MTKAATTRRGDDQSPVPITSAGILEAFKEMVFMVPEAPEDDGSSIIAAMLQATDWTDLNNEDGLPSSQTLVGRDIDVEKIARKVSDKPSATGFYLLCDGTDHETKKAVRFTAGGASVVAALSKCYVSGWLPVRVTFKEVETSSGNTVIECVLKSASGPNVGRTA